MDWAQLANVTASALVTLAALAFAVVYHTHAPWRSTPVGRHIMGFTLAIGALCAYTVAITFFPDGPVAAVLRLVRTGLLMVIACLVVQRTLMVISAQHRGALLGTKQHQDPPA